MKKKKKTEERGLGGHKGFEMSHKAICPPVPTQPGRAEAAVPSVSDPDVRANTRAGAFRDES